MQSRPSASELNEVLQGVATLTTAFARATDTPWVVIVSYEIEERLHEDIHVLAAKLDSQIAGEDFVPPSGRLLRSDIFPAIRFVDMREDTRRRYRTAYEQFLIWRISHALQKPLSELEPWVDYDPPEIDNRVSLWISRGAGRPYLS